MPMVMRGPPRAFIFSTASGAGGTIVATARPPVGEAWDLYQAHGYHDDAARTMGWSVIDTIGPVTWLGPSYAARTYSLWAADNGSPIIPIRLTHEYYMTITAVAMAAGKNLYIAVLVERLTGVDMIGA